MEDAPVIRLTTRRLQPEHEERFLKWNLEVYHPLLSTIPGIEEVDDYRIVKENPLYNKTCTILYYKNRGDQMRLRSDQRFLDVQKDAETTWGSRSELVWWAAYEQIMKFEKDTALAQEQAISEGENTPVIHLEGYDLSNTEQERYDAWFNKLGQEVFIPLIMRLPGLKEYSRYRFIDVERTGLSAFYRTKRSAEYPPYLSILTFDNIKSFENYESSLELRALREALRLLFPSGLAYQWYVQYRLIKSFRK